MPTLAQDGICERDIDYITAIDVERSEALIPAIAVWLENFSYPGRSTEHWGDGQYAVVNIDRSSGLSRESHLGKPRYQQPGTYLFEISGTDGCDREFTVEREVTVPLRLPIDNIIQCPGTVDESACLVPRDQEVSFAISGPDSDVDWIWTGAEEEVIGSELTLTLEQGDIAVIQGTYRADNGEWVVTPYMQVLGIETSRPEIISYTEPGTVQINEPTLLEFVNPVEGTPNITVNGEVVAEATSIEYTFEQPGPHIINYVIARVNAPPLVREIVVHVEAPADFLITILLAATGVLTLLVVGLSIWWLRLARRNRIRRERREIQKARIAARNQNPSFKPEENDIKRDAGSPEHSSYEDDQTARRN